MNFRWEEKLEQKVRDYLEGYSSCHDFFHHKRVRDNALRISEGHNCDREVILAAAWLHDVGYKDFEDDDRNHFDHSADIALEWLPEVGFPREKINNVLEAIKLHDIFARGYNDAKTNVIEIQVLQDADSLEMVGAIGAVRLAYYYGEKTYPIYSDKPIIDNGDVWLNHSILDQYQRDSLKKYEHLNLDTSREVAKERYQFTISFIEEFKKELIGKSL